MTQQDEDTAEVDEAEVMEGMAFITDDQATEVAEPGEEPLDLRAVSPSGVTPTLTPI